MDQKNDEFSGRKSKKGRGGGLGGGAKAPEVEMGWTCGATKRLEVVYPNFVLGAAETGIATSRAARGQMGG